MALIMSTLWSIANRSADGILCRSLMMAPAAGAARGEGLEHANSVANCARISRFKLAGTTELECLSNRTATQSCHCAEAQQKELVATMRTCSMETAASATPVSITALTSCIELIPGGLLMIVLTITAKIAPA